ncbi:MAG: dTDP-4-dehydrorhamnose 3,5-epimerase family protein [Vicinamibacterales bacterium]
MIATQAPLAGAYVLEVERREDARGFFGRVFCVREFAALGLDPAVAQANVSFNRTRGTLRGMHFQYPPHAETKIVRCTRGALLDVIVDLRPESPTYLKHFAVELRADNHKSLYVPRRFAHGYQTLEDDTEVMYLTGEFYAPAAEGGVRFDDESVGISWPLPASEMSPKDLAWPSLRSREPELQQRMAPAVD